MCRRIDISNKFLIILGLFFCFSVSTAFPQIYITSDFITKNSAQPGDTYTGEVSVMNVGDRAEQIRLTQSDYLFTAEGRNYYPEAGSIDRSNAPWIQLAIDDFTINPNEERKISYIVRIPKNADLCGSYWSTILVQAITDTALNNENSGEAKVNSNLRFALQVVTDINDTGTANVVFKDPEHGYYGDDFDFSVSVENTGERYFTLVSTAIIYSSAGEYVGSFIGNKKICYPGTSVRLTVSIPELEKGSYQIQFVADGGENDIFGVLYGLEI